MDSQPFKPPLLPIGIRKLLGTLIILVGLTAYAFAAIWLAIEVLPDHWAVQMIFYPIAGIAWAFPVRPLIDWMQRPDKLD
jgi:membrane protein implicated in regulation of membrane protease activity